MRVQDLPKSRATGCAFTNFSTNGTGAVAYAAEVSQDPVGESNQVAASARCPASMMALRAFSETVTTREGAADCGRSSSANVGTARRAAL